MKKLALSLLMLAVLAGGALAQTVDPGWAAFVIRAATAAPYNQPAIQGSLAAPGAVEFIITEGGQKAGLGTNQINGAKVSQIASLHVDRLDNVATSGSAWGPYFNIWVTDGAGHYAVIANEPSNPEWNASNRWDITSWDMLKTKTCKVFETPGWNTGLSWVHVYTGKMTGLVFEDVANLVIAPPSPAYIADPLNSVGTGAPDVLGTNVAYGYNWMFGDTLANYVTGAPGFIVANYTVSAPLPVTNVTQGTHYGAIQAAINAANAGDVITVAPGTYSEMLTVNKHIDLIGSGSGTNPAVDTIIAGNGTMGSYMVNLQASGVSAADPILFKDLRVNPNGVTGFEIHNAMVVSYVKFDNVKVDGTNETNNTESENGLRIATDGSLSDAVFTNCAFDHLTYGWYFAKNPVLADLSYAKRITVTNTSFSNNDAKGLYIEKLSDASFTGCVVSNNGLFTSFWNNAYNGGCDINLKAGTYANLAFANCVFAGNGLNVKEGAGLFLKGRGTGTLDTSYAANPATLDNVTVTGCTFGGNERGLRLGEPGKNNTTPTNVTVSGCTFTGNVKTYAGSDGSAYGGMVNITTAMANAANNNWGSPSGPTNAALNPTGTGDAVTNLIQFTPWVGRTTSVVARTATPTGSFFTLDGGIPAIGIDGDAPTGYGAGSVKAPNAYTRYGFDLEALFGRPITVGELYRISYVTKKGTLHTVDAADWFLFMYTDPYVGGHSTWYGNRIGSEPYFSQNLVETAGAWNQWTTDAGANNRLRFFDSSPPTNYFGSYTDGFLADLANNATYSSQTILGMGLSVGTAWAAGFNGQLDGLVIELNGGQTLQVNFESGNAAVAMTPATSGPLNCSQSQTVTVNLTKTEGMADVFGFNAVVRATGPVTWGPVTSLSPFGGTTQFYSFNQGDGSYVISGTTVGSPTQPISGAGTTPLFSIQYFANGTGTAAISFDSFSLRDPDNAPIPSVTTGASIAIDCTAPAAVTAITAAPGHNKVAVGWTHNGLDTVTYEVYRGLWTNGTTGVSAYPEYDDLAGNVIPARPGTRAVATAGPAWVLAGTAPAGTTTFTDQWANADSRGVYYYEVFAVDAANNPSPAAAANKRATNYWLGDVDGTAGNMVPNGLVNVYDMTVLGTWFGTASVALNSAASPVDVGPTDNYSRVGIPTTDSKINFEDLMVFAMNFGVVSAAKSEVAVGTSVDLAWVRYDDGSMALRLVDGNGLKGVRVTANVPVGKLAAGRLLDEQSELTFAQNVGETLDASVAVMGVGTTFTGTGDLFVIPAGAAIEAGDLAITARAIDNSTMTVKLTNAAGGQATPRVFALNANYPNPFNPMTKISFSLPEAQKVRLTVFGLDGRKVATLLDENRGAGLHEVVWTGRDDAGQAVASGTYFYRVDAGPYSSVRKMTLMK